MTKYKRLQPKTRPTWQTALILIALAAVLLIVLVVVNNSVNVTTGGIRDVIDRAPTLTP